MTNKKRQQWSPANATLRELLREEWRTDPVLYACLKICERSGASERETLFESIKALVRSKRDLIDAHTDHLNHCNRPICFHPEKHK